MGKVYLVGAGPGAPDLLTVRAHRLIESADVVFYDALVPEAIVNIAMRARRVSVGKRCAAHATAQQFINRQLIEAARREEIVVRLKGGDPMLFGRAQEEIDALNRAGIELEVVPGVTAALAASSSTQVSLTRRAVSRSVVFATPRVGRDERESRWMDAVMAADTAVLYMASNDARAISRRLIDIGMAPSKPVVVVAAASLPDERISFVTLERMARDGIALHDDNQSPILIALGDVYADALAAARHARTDAALGVGGTGRTPMIPEVAA